MARAKPSSRSGRISPTVHVMRWAVALAGTLTALAIIVLIFTDHIAAVPPVAMFGAAITGGTAVKVNISIRR